MTITDQGAGIGWYELFTHCILKFENIFEILKIENAKPNFHF